ncbi:MAG TPA: hypothetical protein VJR89_16355, partial [Polyangiales bacterium]|nr:hypothetical protein [Polyangiales bacterium]
SLGRISGRLPSPDMVVTHSVWDVYLPVGLQYGEPSSNLEQQTAAVTASAEDMKRALESSRASTAVAPLRIEVPAQGVRYSFSKLYANRASEPAEFSLSYSSQGGAWFARLVSLFGAALFWVGLWMLLSSSNKRRAALASTASGAVLVLITASGFGVSMLWPLLGSLVLLGAFGLRWVLANRPRTAAANV